MAPLVGLMESDSVLIDQVENDFEQVGQVEMNLCLLIKWEMTLHRLV